MLIRTLIIIVAATSWVTAQSGPPVFSSIRPIGDNPTDATSVQFEAIFSEPVTGAVDAFVLGNDQDSMGGGFEYSQAFPGHIDELRIWSGVRALEQLALSRGTPIDPGDPALRHYWRFDELEDLGAGEPGVNDVRDLAGGAHFDLVGGADLGPGAPSTRWRVDLDLSAVTDATAIALDVLPDGNIEDADGHRLRANPLAQRAALDLR